MSHQYRLRLRDGTVLAVDYDGLRTWLLDDRAMAQPPGSRRWRPLKEVLAAGRPAVVAPPRAEAPSPSPVKVEDVPAPPRAAARPGEGLPLIPLEESLDAPVPSRSVAVAPLAEPTPPRATKPDDGLPIIPFKPLEEDEVIPQPTVEPDIEQESEVRVRPESDEGGGEIAESAPASQSLLDVASAELERHIAGDRPWQWSPREGRKTPLGAGAAATSAARPESGQGDEVLDELDLIEADEGFAAAPIGQNLARSVSEKFDRLAESVGHLGDGVGRLTRSAARLKGWVGRFTGVGKRLAGRVGGLVGRVRRAAAPSRAEPAAPWAAGPTRAEPLKPPPATRDLPVLRLAPMAREATDLYEGEGAVGRIWPWVKRAALIGGLAAVVAVTAATWRTWMPGLTRLAQSVLRRDGKAGSGAGPSLPSTEEKEAALPKEVQLAANQLPHLAPGTIQLVMSSEYGAADAPELFRRAHVAASRGARALTAPEARELTRLQGAVLAPLRPVDRERVQAYDRVSVGRYLLSGEDAKVLALYARGVRALPRQSRERLQTLYGKAVAAALVPGSSTAGATAEAPATR